jgi:putative ABC transport system permease protein
MRLALAEIRRSRGRFVSITAALSLIVFLVLTLSALADGLYFGGTGAVRTSTATAYAFNADAPGSLIRSRLPEADVARFAAAPGVEQASPLGVLLTGGRAAGEEVDLAVFGIEPDGAGVPAEVVTGRLPGAPGEAAVDRVLDGVAIGDRVDVGGVSATVVGLVADAQYQGQASVWTPLETWRDMRTAVRPETAGEDDVITAVALRTAEGTDLAALAAAVPGTAVQSSEETALSIPGIREQRSTLGAIIYATLGVAALVVALFFALLVLEKRELFASLKALGSSTRRLAGTVVTQAVVATAAGLVVGAVASRLLGAAVPDEVPTLFRTETLLTISAFALVAGVLGALLSLRRIARIDPASALGGTL